MGFAIRIGLHNNYDVILYVWRPCLKRRVTSDNIATSVNGESQYRTNSKTTMPIIFSETIVLRADIITIMISLLFCLPKRYGSQSGSRLLILRGPFSVYSALAPVLPCFHIHCNSVAYNVITNVIIIVIVKTRSVMMQLGRDNNIAVNAKVVVS